MNIEDANQERIENLKQKIEDVIRKNLPDFSESGNGTIPYISVLPGKYARYYTFFDPNNQSFTGEGKARLRQIHNAAKRLWKLFYMRSKDKQVLPAAEYCLLNKNFNFSFGLGTYAAATYGLMKATEKTIENINIPRGRRKNPYYELVSELAKDFKLVTGHEPKLSKNPITGEPSGKFYNFVSEMFDALNMQGKANIEKAIRSLYLNEK